jgi:Icc-related predicted phosphoesterase
MKFSYASDLHLEFGDYPNLSKEPGGDVLLLAGDIFVSQLFRGHRTDGTARKFYKYLKTKFKPQLLDKYEKVYMVMGNHEHYNSVFKNTVKELRQGFKNHNLPIVILDDDRVELGDKILIGSTLWSNYENGNPTSMNLCEHGMNDYRLIGQLDVDDLTYFNRYHHRTITPEFLLETFNRSLAYIKNILMLYPDKEIVVMTHHAPSSKSLNKEHIGNGMDGAYYSDLSNFILDNPNIKYWISGHTHVQVEYEIGNTTCLSNCMGYSFEPSYRRFTGFKHFEI